MYSGRSVVDSWHIGIVMVTLQATNFILKGNVLLHYIFDLIQFCLWGVFFLFLFNIWNKQHFLQFLQCLIFSRYLSDTFFVFFLSCTFIWSGTCRNSCTRGWCPLWAEPTALRWPKSASWRSSSRKDAAARRARRRRKVHVMGFKRSRPTPPLFVALLLRMVLKWCMNMVLFVVFSAQLVLWGRRSPWAKRTRTCVRACIRWVAHERHRHTQNSSANSSHGLEKPVGCYCGWILKKYKKKKKNKFSQTLVSRVG